MQIQVDPNGHLPVHVQLYQQLRILIQNGDLEPGTHLPTIRQLAGFLRINRNTVLRAYQDLAREGLIECRQGRGCVVLERPPDAAAPAPPHLLESIDRVVEQASSAGIAPDDLIALVYARVRQRLSSQPRPSLVFVECEAQVAADYARVIRERMDADVTPLTLRDLQQPEQETLDQLAAARLVVTTFFHVQEVRDLLSDARQVVGLTVKPHLEALVEVARIPKGTRVALVCTTKESAQLMQRSLHNTGIGGLNTSTCGADDPRELDRVLSQVSAVVASDHVSQQVQPMLRPDQQLVVLHYLALDEGGLGLLRSML